jgi:hypothetical protein
MTKRIVESSVVASVAKISALRPNDPGRKGTRRFKDMPSLGKRRRMVHGAVGPLAILIACAGAAYVDTAQETRPLRGIKTLYVEDTVIGNPKKVGEDFAPNLVKDSLRNALRLSNFEIAENVEKSDVRAHLVLDEFSSGNMAKRAVGGLFGAGRGTVDGRLVIQSADGRELANRRVRARGVYWVLLARQPNGGKQRQASSRPSSRKLRDSSEL